MSVVISSGSIFADASIVTEGLVFGLIEDDGLVSIQAIGDSQDAVIVDPSAESDYLVRLGDGDDITALAQGDDIALGEAGDDIIYANGGDDVVRGGSGNDRLFGNGGDDLLIGGSGDDSLSGGLNDDILKGGAGDDLIVFGRGFDRATGGQGVDRFRLESGSQLDIVTDFDPGEDLLEVARSVVPGSNLDKGELKNSDFEKVETIGESDALIIYESSTGIVYYNSGLQPVAIVRLPKDLNLSAQDIAIV